MYPTRNQYEVMKQHVEWAYKEACRNCHRDYILPYDEIEKFFMIAMQEAFRMGSETGLYARSLEKDKFPAEMENT